MEGSDTMTTSDAMATLRHVHDGGLEKLKLLSGTVSRPNWETDSKALTALKELLQFFDGELRVHFRHEEEALFPALEKIIGKQGPIMVMLDEHQSFWQAIDTLHERVGALEAGGRRDEVARTTRLAADHVVSLLNSHIDKENNILFPMAEESLSARTLQQIAAQMKAIG